MSFPLGIIFSAITILFAVCVAFFSNVDMFSLIVISVFGLICFAVVVSWGAAATKVCGEAKGDNADANDVANKKPSKNSEITGRTAVKRPEPSNGKDKHTDREDNVWCIANYYFWKITKALDSIGGLITALATVALVAVTIGLVVIANKSDETSRITNRAYVFLQDISLVNDGQNWHLIPQWVNGGNITTEDMKMRINFVGLTGPTGINPHFVPGFSRCDVASQPPSVPIVLGPKQPSTVSFLSTPGEEFVKFQNGTTKKFYLWGRSTYYDSFSAKRRITRFCFDIEKIIGNPMDPMGKLDLLHGLCTESNCTDEDCDKEDARLPPASCTAPKFQKAD